MPRVNLFLSDKTWDLLKQRAGLPTDHPRQNARGLPLYLEALSFRRFTDVRPWKAQTGVGGVRWWNNGSMKLQRTFELSDNSLARFAKAGVELGIEPQRVSFVAVTGVLLEAIGCGYVEVDVWPNQLLLTKARVKSGEKWRKEDAKVDRRFNYWLEHRGEDSVQE